MSRFHLRLFLLLFVAGLVGAAAVLPYVFTTAGLATASLSMPLPAVAALQLLESAILLGVAVAVGMMLYREAGLRLPYLEPLAEGRRLPAGAWTMIWTSLLAGVCTVFVLWILDYAAFGVSPLDSVSGASVPLWQRVLATLYGGIDEELFMRFFFLSLLAWIFGRVSRRSDRTPSTAGWWGSIVLTAVIFGAGHVPVASQLMDLTWTVVARSMALNGVVAMVFGWLYWKKGLESAMVAHFASALMLLVVLPMFAS